MQLLRLFLYMTMIETQMEIRRTGFALPARCNGGNSRELYRLLGFSFS